MGNLTDLALALSALEKANQEGADEQTVADLEAEARRALLLSNSEGGGGPRAF